MYWHKVTNLVETSLQDAGSPWADALCLLDSPGILEVACTTVTEGTSGSIQPMSTVIIMVALPTTASEDGRVLTRTHDPGGGCCALETGF